jgi:hypothetical protein
MVITRAERAMQFILSALSNAGRLSTCGECRTQNDEFRVQKRFRHAALWRFGNASDERRSRILAEFG